MRFVSIVVLSAWAISASAEESSTFTYSSGVALLEQAAASSNEAESVKVLKVKVGYEVRVLAFMPCQGAIAAPWLTLGPKATLVLGKVRSSGGFSTKEECKYKLRISIAKDRLGQGNTLYVVNDQVVVGHSNVP